MNTILKFPIAWKHQGGDGITSIACPTNARIVLAGQQHGQPMLWIEGNADAVVGLNQRQFAVVGTGEEYNGRNVGSFQDGAYVWHIIEVTPPKSDGDNQ